MYSYLIQITLEQIFATTTQAESGLGSNGNGKAPYTSPSFRTWASMPDAF